MSKESRLIKNTAIIAVGNIGMKLVSFLMFPLYTAVLTTSEYGTVDFIIVIGTLLFHLFSLQLQQGAFRFLIEARENKDQISRIITTTTLCLLVSMGNLVLLTGILWGLTKYQYTFYIGAFVALLVLSDTVLYISRGLGDNTTYTIGSTLGGTLRILLNVLFVAVLRIGVKGMLWAELMASVTSMLYPFFRLKLWQYLSLKAADISLLNLLCRYSFPLIPYTLCWWIVGACDRISLSLFLGTAANGIYSAAGKFSSTFTLVTGIFQTSWTESASENVNVGDRNGFYHAVLNKTIRFYSSANIGIIALLPFVFPILIHDNFAEAYLYIPVLMSAALLHAVANLFGSVYTAFKRTKQIAMTTVLSAIMNVVINIACIPYFGIYAAAFSTLTAYGLIAIIQYGGTRAMVAYRLPWRYLLVEAMVYTVVLSAYYSGNMAIQFLALLLLVPYCCYQNRDILRGLLQILLSKCKKK